MNTEWKQLFNTIEVSTSPYHCIAEAERQLREAGFEELDLKERWQILSGGKYYVNAYGTTVIAFKINSIDETGGGFRIGCAHTDWPCLRIKPNPDMTAGNYKKLNVEVYGGPIFSSWMDRPLSIAGRVTLKGADAFHPQERLIDFARSIITIPNLAIHMNREVNKGMALNPQIDLLPLLEVMTDEGGEEQSFFKMLAKEMGILAEDILDYDLYIYNAEKGCLTGAKQNLISAPRLDNVTSCQACVNGIIDGKRKSGIDVIALFDNEECGSRSKQGADSLLFAYLLEKIILCLGLDRERYLSMILDSFLVSADVAHAIHVNHPEKCDITNQASLGSGFCIKMESNQRYATDGMAVAVIEEICKQNKISYKKFVNRSDIRGGSTLGSILSAFLPAKTVDIGIPILAMHSARELMAANDQCQLNRVMRAFFSEE